MVRESSGTDCLVSSEKKPLSFISYELVFEFINDKRYLRSFNLTDRQGKLIKKYYLSQLILCDENLQMERVVSEYILLDILNKSSVEPQSGKTSVSGKKGKRNWNHKIENVKKNPEIFESVNNFYKNLGI